MNTARALAALVLAPLAGVRAQAVPFSQRASVTQRLGNTEVTIAYGRPYRRTHDLAELLDLLSDRRMEYPQQLEDAVALTPFAAEMRYDYLPPETDQESPFDRAAAVQLAELAIQWATKVQNNTPSP